MKATDLIVGSKVKSSIFKSANEIGIVIECNEKQLVFSQKHDTVQLVDSLASGRKLHLKQSIQKVSRINLQRILDGKVFNGIVKAEILSI